ncbi:MAG: hypothetical protein JNN32_01100 [Flavobacteriales bacterium]|nr:hypothetical protein [Flavobacteriales bacterium]
MRWRTPPLPILGCVTIGLLAAQAVVGQVAPSNINLVPIAIPALPRCDIHAMLKDTDGFLWIGTHEGLFRYDGSNLDVYRKVPGDSTSLPDDRIFSLVPDAQGRIGVATMAGVCTFHPRETNFRRVHYLREGKRHDRESRLHRDASDQLWASFYNEGVGRYDTASNTFTDVPRIREAAKHLRGRRCTALTSDKDGTLWITNDGGLLRYAPDTDQTEFFPYAPIGLAPGHPPITLSDPQMDPEDPNLIWMESWGSGIVRFDKRTGAFKNWLHEREKPWNVSNIVFSFSPLGKGRWLVGFDHRLRVFDTNTESFSEPVDMNLPQPTPLEYPVLSQYRHNGQLWIGSGGVGVYMIPDAPCDMVPLAHANYLCPARAGGYWGSTIYEQRRLRRLDDQGSLLFERPLPDADKSGYEAFRLVERQDGEVWLSTTAGLLVYDPVKDAFHWKAMNGAFEAGAPEQLGYDIVEQANGEMWTIGWAKGPIRYSPTNDRWDIPWRGQPIDTLLIGTQGVGTLDADHLWLRLYIGAGILNTRTMQLEHIMTEPNPGPGTQPITAVVAHDAGRMDLVTATNGIYTAQYDGEQLAVTGHFQHPNNTEKFHEATTDSRGYTWITTSHGLVRFDGRTGSFDHLRAVSGLPVQSAFGIINDADGSMVIRGSKLLRFHPDSIDFSLPRTPVYIRQLSVNGARRHGSELSLPYDSSSVSIEYAAIALTNAEDIRYEVQLKGYDPHWVDNGTRRTASYINLPPGAYTFLTRVKGAPEGSTVGALRFTIHPAWWQRWWFRSAAVLFSMLMVFLLSRYILRLQYERRIAALEQEKAVGAVRTRIARDIHDDIGSGLTKIALLSRELHTSADKERLTANIASASTELIGQLGDIIWTVNPAQDHAEHFMAYVRDQLGRQFEEMNVDLTTDLTIEPGMEHRDVPPDVKRNVMLILKEMVANALKHAHPRKVEVRLTINAAALLLHFADDGCGFDVQATTLGNGRGNLQRRCNELGGTLSVVSDATGTRYTLQVPLPDPTFMRAT